MIPDFHEDELGLVAALLERRYGRAIAFESAEVEMQLEAGAAAPTRCPAVYWEARGAQFAVCKTAEGRYRGQFFEGEEAPSSTARSECEDLGDCVTALLRIQSDHERARAGAVPGATAATLSAAGDYDGPAVI